MRSFDDAMARETRYWERFDPDFFREKPYRRLIWRSMLGVLAIAVGIVVWGAVWIADGRGRGWLVIVGAVFLLLGARSMGWWLFKTRHLVDEDREPAR